MTLYRNVDGARVAMTADEERAFENTREPKHRIPQPRPDLQAAIQALIDGDNVAAQAALDRKV